MKDKTEKDPATYVQTTRKRFQDEGSPLEYMKAIAPSRMPVAVIVPDVELDDKGYPILKK